jgi:signal transduction histidine kinase
MSIFRSLTMAVLACLLACQAAGASTAEIDSLRSALVVMPADTNRVNALQQLSVKLFFARSDSGLAPALEGERVARSMNYWRGIMLNLYAQGLNHYGAGDYEAAATHYQQALELAEGLQTPKVKFKLLNNLGVTYNLTAKYTDALKVYHQCLDLAPKAGMEKHLPAVLMNIGNIFSLVGDHEEAKDSYLRAIDHLGGQDSPLLASLYNNLQTQYLFLDRTQEALKWGRLSLDKRLGMCDPIMIAEGKSNLAGAMVAADKLDSARILITEALPVMRTHPQQEKLSNSLFIMGNIIWAEGSAAQARLYYLEALDIAEQFKDASVLQELYPVLAEVEAALGNLKESARNWQLHYALADSINNVEFIREITQIKEKHEAELSLALFEQRSRARNNLFLVITLAVLLLALLLARLLRVQKTLNRTLNHRNEDLEKQVVERTQKLRRLSDHIFTLREDERKRLARDIHDDLSQSLAAIQLNLSHMRDSHANEALAADLDRVVAITKAALKESSRLIKNLRPFALDELGLDGALGWLADSHRARHGRPVELDLAENCRCDDKVTIVLYRIAQEALHNIAKHSQAEHAALSLKCDKESIILTVSDDGRGFNPGKTRSESFGLLGIREAAIVVGGQFHLVTGPGEGTEVKVRIPRSERPQAAAGVA